MDYPLESFNRKVGVAENFDLGRHLTWPALDLPAISLHNERCMSHSPLSLEPLADYIEPQFGNVYEYNIQSSRGGAEQPWTTELHAAVTHYLVHEVTDEDWRSFLDILSRLYIDDIPDATRAQQAASILALYEPWMVAQAFHLAAVNAVPALDQLIGHLDDWGDGGLQEDAGAWLTRHASHEQLVELSRVANDLERNPTTPWYHAAPTGWNLTGNVAPPTLLTAWRQVVGAAESDLTDD
jgi:hypothetical protein